MRICPVCEQTIDGDIDSHIASFHPANLPPSSLNETSFPSEEPSRKASDPTILQIARRGFWLMSVIWFVTSVCLGQARWIAVLFVGAVLVVMDTCGTTTTYEGVEALDHVKGNMIFSSLFFAIPGLLWWLLAFLRSSGRLKAIFYLFSAVCGSFAASAVTNSLAPGSGLGDIGQTLVFGGMAGAFALGALAGLVFSKRDSRLQRSLVFGLLFLLSYQILLGIATPLASWMMKQESLIPVLIFFAAETGVLLIAGLLWLRAVRRAKGRKELGSRQVVQGIQETTVS